MNWPFQKDTPSRDGLFAALDVGSSKVICLIARAENDGQLRIVGLGHQLSAGVRSGVITDMEAAQRAIAAAVSAAEDMAKERVESVTVSISGGQVASHSCQVDLPLGGREVASQDITRLLTLAADISVDIKPEQPQEVIHTLPVGYSLDGNHGIRDPRGMIGQSLGVHLHAITAGYGPVRTLASAIARCHLEVEQIVAGSYASGLSCLVEDEMDLGCTVIDMGAGTTSFAIFFDGQCVFTDGIPVGGQHVTSDIARGLTTSMSHAERLKTLYGNALPSSIDDREMVDVPQLGEDQHGSTNHVPKSHLIHIIQPRLEEIFEMVRNKLNASNFADVAGRRVVVTGGTSQMPGLREMATRVLDKHVRLGRPIRLGLAPHLPPQFANSHGNGRNGNGNSHHHNDVTSGPAFATVLGLLTAAMQPSPIAVRNFGDLMTQGSFVTRVSQWLKQNI